MAHDVFLMDNGRIGSRPLPRTRLTRQPRRIGSTVMVWRDDSGEITFDENIDGHPIDGFGLPIFGNFATTP